MWCVLGETKCRLFGRRFLEDLCLDEKGMAWHRSLSSSPENDSPWCPACLAKINRGLRGALPGPGGGAMRAHHRLLAVFAHPDDESRGTGATNPWRRTGE